MSNVTTHSIVNELQELIVEAKANKNLDIEKRVKLISTLTGQQLRAGALTLQFARAVSRLPENAGAIEMQLNTTNAQPPALQQ